MISVTVALTLALLLAAWRAGPMPTKLEADKVVRMYAARRCFTLACFGLVVMCFAGLSMYSGGVLVYTCSFVCLGAGFLVSLYHYAIYHGLRPASHAEGKEIAKEAENRRLAKERALPYR